MDNQFFSLNYMYTVMHMLVRRIQRKSVAQWREFVVYLSPFFDTEMCEEILVEHYASTPSILYVCQKCIVVDHRSISNVLQDNALKWKHNTLLVLQHSSVLRLWTIVRTTFVQLTFECPKMRHSGFGIKV